MKKRIVSLLLALLIAVSLLPGAAFASDREEVCAVIAEGISNWETEIDVSEYEVSVSELEDCFLSVVNNHPELFYVKGYECSAESYVITINPVYNESFSPSSVSAFNSKCSEIKAGMPSSGTTEEASPPRSPGIWGSTTTR